MILLANAIKCIEAGIEPTPDIWGPDAYYFGADEELAFVDYMTALVKVLKGKGIVDTEELKTIDRSLAASATGAEAAEADSWAEEIVTFFSVNMRVRSSRGLKIGWKCKERKVRDTLEEVTSYLELKG